MDQIDELRCLLKPLFDRMEKEEADRVENLLRRLETTIGMQEKKYSRAIQDRQAVHSLLKKTSDELVQRYRTIFEHSGNPMVAIEKDGTIILANSLFCTLTGQTVAEIEKKANITNYLAGDTGDPLPGEMFATGEDIVVSGTTAGRIHLPDGRIRDVIISMGAFTGSTQRSVTFLDVTERNQLERELLDSEEKYRALAESTSDLHFSATTEGIFTYVSPQIRQYGFSIEEVMGRHMFHYIHPDDRVDVIKHFNGDICTTSHATSVFRILDREGDVHWVEQKATLIFDQDNHPLRLFGILRDINDRKKAEAAIELANSKLNLMNNITRHDILNTITGIYGCVDMLRAGGHEAGNDALLAGIKEQVRMIQRQIAFTKEYQEVGIHMPQWQNVRTVIGKVLGNFGKSPFAINVEIGELEVYADPLFEKVIYNLLDNAVRYAGHATRLSFSSRRSGKSLIITCDDDGVGVPEDQKIRIFERGIGKNTGMGLFLTREILEITGITIREVGVPGKGARFEISIPLGGYREMEPRPYPS
jgi:PAS domain S-box-containing protein